MPTMSVYDHYLARIQLIYKDVVYMVKTKIQLPFLFDKTNSLASLNYQVHIMPTIMNGLEVISISSDRLRTLHLTTC